MLLVLVLSGASLPAQETNPPAFFQHPSLTKVWELTGKLKRPESAVYEVKKEVFLVSNFGDGTVSRIGPDGTVIVRKWCEGLDRPAGLAIHGDKLLAVERKSLAEVDLETGRILKRIPLLDAKFPNDLVVDGQGAVYVTDTRRGCVYRLADGQVEVWLEGEAFREPNGICLMKDRLLVGTRADGAIKSIDLKTRQVTTLQALGPDINMDGLLGDGQGGYLFSEYAGRIYRVDAAGQRTLLLDRRGLRQFTADFWYSPEKHLLVVPSLNGDLLTAYSYNPDTP